MSENSYTPGLLSILCDIVLNKNQDKSEEAPNQLSPDRKASESLQTCIKTPLSSLHSSFTKSSSMGGTPQWRKGSIDINNVTIFVPEVANPRRSRAQSCLVELSGVKNDGAETKAERSYSDIKDMKGVEILKKEASLISGKDGLADRSTEEENDTLRSPKITYSKHPENLLAMEPQRRSTRQRQMGVLRKRIKDISSSEEDEEENNVIFEDTEKLPENCTQRKLSFQKSNSQKRSDKEFPILKMLEILKPKTKRKIEARERSNSRSNSRKKPKNFKCPIEACCKKFRTGQALGGHMSRAHPNQSTDYKVKQSIRERRTLDRIILKKAKEQYANKFGDISSLNRCRLKRIKDSIVEDSKAMVRLKSLADEEMNHKLKKKKTGANSE